MIVGFIFDYFSLIICMLFVGTSGVIVLTTSKTLLLFFKMAKMASISYPFLEDIHFIIGMPNDVGNSLNTYVSLAKGLIIFEENQGKTTDFTDYFNAIEPGTSDNPWISDYWKFVFSTCEDSAVCIDKAKKKNDNLLLVSQVTGAVYVYAYALQDIKTKHCEERPATSCFPLMFLQVEEFVSAMKSTSFVNLDGQVMAFDSYGNPIGQSYLIRNLQISSSVPAAVSVGTWKKSTRLRLFSPFKFYDKFSVGLSTYPKSQCISSCVCISLPTEYRYININYFHFCVNCML